MKKILIGLLFIAAAGTGVYYLLKEKGAVAGSFKKELIIGKWKIDSLVAADTARDDLALLFLSLDTNFLKHVYDVRDNGHVLVSLPADSLAKKDTAAYAWVKEDEIKWKDKYTDSTSDLVKVIKLDSKDFILRTKDSTLIYFSKIE